MEIIISVFCAVLLVEGLYHVIYSAEITNFPNNSGLNQEYSVYSSLAAILRTWRNFCQSASAWEFPLLSIALFREGF